MFISDFQNVCFLPPKIKVWFLGINAHKIEKFKYIKKLEYILLKNMPVTAAQKFKPMSLSLAAQWPKNHLRLMTSLFEARFLGF